MHASAALTGARAVLIRGPAGSGKTRLVLGLIDAAKAGRIPFARLVADDRVELEVWDGRLLLRPPAALAGLIEVRGVGIRRMAFEAVVVAGSVVDLDAADAERMPAATAQSTAIEGITLPRLAVAPGADALAMLLAVLATAPG